MKHASPLSAGGGAGDTVSVYLELYPRQRKGKLPCQEDADWFLLALFLKKELKTVVDRPCTRDSASAGSPPLIPETPLLHSVEVPLKACAWFTKLPQSQPRQVTVTVSAAGSRWITQTWG